MPGAGKLIALLLLFVSLSASAETAVLFVVPTKWVVARQFFPILDLLREEGVRVDVASDRAHTHEFWEDYVACQTSSAAPSLSRYALDVILTYDDVDVDSYDAFLVPGGHSHHGIIADERARAILTLAASAGKVVGGLGQGVSVLVELDLIAGHKATIAPGDADDAPTPNSVRIIEEAGGTFIWDCVVTSSSPSTGFTLITATSQCVHGFAREVLRCLEAIAPDLH